MKFDDKRVLLGRCRRAVRHRALGRAHGTGAWKGVRLALRNPHFPLSYCLRNLMLLRRESSWQGLSPREKGRMMLHVLGERARFFLHVKEWLEKNGGCRAVVDFSPPSPVPEPDSYCIHCGGCCETPSGFPDFPEESVVPGQWKDIFGRGLGRGHRFCPFLWEYRNTGMSLCSIHPWRANPCRTFGEDDCRYVLQDPDMAHVTDPERTRRVCALLVRMLGGR